MGYSRSKSTSAHSENAGTPSGVRGKLDWSLVVATGTLIAVGAVMVAETTGPTGAARFGDATVLLRQHVLAVLAGTMLMGVISFLPPRTIERLAYVPLLVCLALLMIAAWPESGATRFMSVGWPGERGATAFAVAFAKPGLVLALARWQTRGDRIRSLTAGILPATCLLMVTCTAMLAHAEFASTSQLFLATILLLVFSGAKWNHVLVPISVGVGVTGLAIALSQTLYVRFSCFLNPIPSGDGCGEVLVQSLAAIQRGGLTGVGLGNTRAAFAIPSTHDHFVLSVVAESFGLVGVVVLVAVFAFVARRAFAIARQQVTAFGRTLASGLTLLITVGATMHLGVVYGWLPTFGVPLPFISYGGTELIANMFSVGLLMALSRAPSRSVV